MEGGRAWGRCVCRAQAQFVKHDSDKRGNKHSSPGPVPSLDFGGAIKAVKLAYGRKGDMDELPAVDGALDQLVAGLAQIR